MKQLMRLVVLSLVPLGVFVSAGCAAMTETEAPAPPAHTASVPANKPAWLTPEKEVALVEVRKILKEAWEVADHIALPSPLFTKEAKIKTLNQVKQRLLGYVNDAQVQAGDFSNVPHSIYPGPEVVVLEQIRYGSVPEAKRGAVDDRISQIADVLLILKALADAGDLSGAQQVAETKLRRTSRGGAELKEYEAAVLAYMARRHAEVGKPEADELLGRAMEAARSNDKHLYLKSAHFLQGAWAAIGCAQVAMGDRAAAEASMRRAMTAAVSLPKEEYVGQKAEILRLIGRAAIRVGLTPVSQEAFQEALQFAQQIEKPDLRTRAMTKVAVFQSQAGDRLGGQRTLDEVFSFARNLPDQNQRRRALSIIVEQQFEEGDPEGAAATLDRRRQWAATIADLTEREVELSGIQWWDTKLLPPQVALEQVYAAQGDDEKQAKALGTAVYILVHRPQSMATPETFKRLSQTAAVLLAKPLPADEKRANDYLSSLAAVQAVTDGVAQALQTLGRITNAKRQTTTPTALLSLLIQKRDLAGAKLLIGFPDRDDVGILSGSSGDTLGDKIQKVAKIQAGMGDVPGALQWAHQQTNPYAKAMALLGVALGLMEREGVENIRRQWPPEMVIVKAGVGSARLGCAAL